MSRALWVRLDADGNGFVDEEEFTSALETMFTERGAWLRYCPTCSFDGTCAACIECAACPDCSERSFCPTCWASHPGNPESVWGWPAVPKRHARKGSGSPKRVTWAAGR